MRKLVGVLVGMLLAVSAIQAKELVNVDKTGLALQGYDPVAFFSEGKAVMGRQDLTAIFQGATYRFSSEEHESAFIQDPHKYAPAFGGFCAYAVSQGHTAPVEIGTWQVVGGRLLLNYSQKVRELFDADREGNLKKADGNWPRVMEKDGK